MQLLKLLEFAQVFLLLLISVEIALNTYKEKSISLLIFLAMTKICLDSLYVMYAGNLDLLPMMIIVSDILIISTLICDFIMDKISSLQPNNPIVTIFKFGYLLLIAALPIIAVLIIAYLVVHTTNIIFCVLMLILIVCLLYKAVIIFATLLIIRNKVYKKIEV